MSVDEQAVREKIEWALLRRWSALSPGDRSIVDVMLRDESHQALTAVGTPHEMFWYDPSLLRWAEAVPVEMNLDSAALDVTLIEKAKASMRAYRFTDAGRRVVPRLIARYAELLPRTVGPA